MSPDLLRELAITAELTGTQMSEGASKAFARHLARYPEPQVLGALQRCQRELRGRMTLADVMDRLDDGRPTPDEAWAMYPRDEDETAVLTLETMSAMEDAHRLLADGDRVAARMAFLDSYRRLVRDAREAAMPARWMPSLGQSPGLRAGALGDAVARGRLELAQALPLVPAEALEAFYARLPEPQRPMLPALAAPPVVQRIATAVRQALAAPKPAPVPDRAEMERQRRAALRDQAILLGADPDAKKSSSRLP